MNNTETKKNELNFRIRISRNRLNDVNNTIKMLTGKIALLAQDEPEAPYIDSILAYAMEVKSLTVLRDGLEHELEALNSLNTEE